jgi:integrase
MKKIKDIKAYHIQEIVKHMADKGKKDIIKRTVSTIKRILGDAIHNDIIYKNVANNIDTPKFVQNERKPLSVSTDRLVVAECQKHKYGLFILLIRYTGIRLEEAIPILITDFDLKTRTVTINKAVTFIHNQPVVKATKNLKSRTIPLPKILIKPLKKEIEKRKELGIPYLFTKEREPSSMLSKQAVRTHLDSFLYALNKNRKKKIKFTLHQLRHSYCTMLYYAGIKIKKAQELMRSFFC